MQLFHKPEYVVFKTVIVIMMWKQKDARYDFAFKRGSLPNFQRLWCVRAILLNKMLCTSSFTQVHTGR